MALGTLLLLLAAGPWVGSCSAAMMLGPAIPLSDLVDNPEGIVDVGDKRFSQFQYEFTNDMPDASGVNVIPIQDNDGNYGLRFQGFFTDLATSQGGSDALITYTVEVTDPRRLISDAHLMGNLVIPDEEGIIGVTETFLPLGTDGSYTMKIFDSVDSGAKLAEWVDFLPPVKSLEVQKDIGAFGFSGSFPPMASFVDQTFSQIFVPEAGPLLLALTGLVALGVLMRYGGVNHRKRGVLYSAPFQS